MCVERLELSPFFGTMVFETTVYASSTTRTEYPMQESNLQNLVSETSMSANFHQWGLYAYRDSNPKNRDP